MRKRGHTAHRHGRAYRHLTAQNTDTTADTHSPTHALLHEMNMWTTTACAVTHTCLLAQVYVTAWSAMQPCTCTVACLIADALDTRTLDPPIFLCRPPGGLPCEGCCSSRCSKMGLPRTPSVACLAICTERMPHMTCALARWIARATAHAAYGCSLHARTRFTSMDIGTQS